MERTEPKFWGSYKGKIIKSISVDGARTWDDIQELTGLNRSVINKVLAELFNNDAIYKTKDNEYRVAKDLYFEYRAYFTTENGGKSTSLKVKLEDQQKIIREFQSWISFKSLELKDNHIFLEGGNLDGLTTHLIEKVKTEILVINPFVDKSNLMDLMKKRADNGVTIKVLTRRPENQDKHGYIDNLQEYKMDIKINKDVHAKIMVFDRGVAIISSMNLYTYSIGGGSWEAGIATSSEDVVSDVLNGISTKFDEKETSTWNESSGK